MSKSICYSLAAGLALCLAPAWAAGPPADFLGANSCASASCHGGGGPNKNQFLIWSLEDFHSQRPVATLATARAREIANAAGIADPATDPRCTSCHAPLNDVPESLRGKNFNVAEGVSCENCHGPAGNWIRSHTRTDYTRADCTAAGMRDLQDLYVRANTCVACHQVVAEPLLDAGHPELIFELDGQSVAEPKHWTAANNGNGAQAWFVGQSVALRELSWQLTREKSPASAQMDAWRGLVWLMVRIGKIDSNLPAPPDTTFRPNPENFEQIQKWSDNLARAAAGLSWTDQMRRAALAALAATSSDFRETIPQPVQARRAERLVLALDRLFGAQRSPQTSHELDQLFKLVQSRPDFNSAAFAAALEKFSRSINPV